MAKIKSKKPFGCLKIFLIVVLIIVLTPVVLLIAKTRYDDYKERKIDERVNKLLIESTICDYNPGWMKELSEPDADPDGDGLTNAEEEEKWGTDPFSVDTDGDGLSDYDEIYIYKSDPLKPSTMGDGINDMVKVIKGLDLNKKYKKRI